MNENVGIDAINFSLPRLTLPIEDLAEARGLEVEKLKFGLGLKSMSVCDLDEDVVTLAADAVWKLIERECLNPKEIGRIYLGTESSVDAAKPTSTYVLDLLERKLEVNYGPRSLSHCDVVDMTFACVGAVDAFQNSLDWVSIKKDRKAIVVASDVAKYSPSSSGEYTQGAGAVSMLLSKNPRILALDSDFAVSIQSTGDFFKPRRTFKKLELLQEASNLLGLEKLTDEVVKRLESKSDGFWGTPMNIIDQFLEFPIYDGPFSNECYVSRVREALIRYENKRSQNVLDDWDGMIFHLPYAFQGRRMWPEISLDLYRKAGRLSEIEKAIGEKETEVSDKRQFIRLWSKSELFKKIIKEKIAPGEQASQRIGNMYTASIFMAFLSKISLSPEEGKNLKNKRIGFLSYGSGSKSKVFSGTIQNMFENQIHGINLFDSLDSTTTIDFKTYEDLHQRKLESPISKTSGFSLKKIGEKDLETGYRFYDIK